MRSGKKSIKRILGIIMTAAVLLCVIAAATLQISAAVTSEDARSVSDALHVGAAGNDPTTAVHIFVIVLLTLTLAAEVAVVLVLVLSNYYRVGGSQGSEQQQDNGGYDAYGYPAALTDTAGSSGFVLLRPSSHEIIRIDKAEFYLGKERSKVDYCINDNNYVSRRHAKISVYDGRCYISDLGSTNCTYINGIRISPDREIALLPGDRIGLSNEEFVFTDRPAIAS